ncbi:hypothetical protein H310_08556 [Aphanomyces invadans]|uniref:EF-hand domain-containing protein n=1 Tax=Aphanomyces invadans TaxID=157072 RepID=A0A024U0K5_9STRA|nr:hypothetical protein H310_08556 [Aphanomyces invadans]ETV99152.1 hypothetical protein H310_08556 [Aphanomyces invadans]|eukprot:XP_008872581.1 hypothetical protein H310_08556 [Aphanomyces invadans]
MSNAAEKDIADKPDGDGHKKFQRISLGCLTVKNPVRRLCIKIVTWKWFDRAIVFCVVFNTVILGLTDYTDAWVEGPNMTIWINWFIDKCNSVSFWIFLAEATVKIVAMGFCFGERAYFSDGWNRLDLVIVASGVLAMLNFKGVKVGYIRVLRVMRPLRTLHSLPGARRCWSWLARPPPFFAVGLKVLTNSLLASLPALANVFVLLMFCTLVFAILGMEMYRGTFHYRCRATPFPVALPPNGTFNYPPNASYISTVQAAPDLFPCMMGSAPISQNMSVWPEPQDCFWPSDPGERTPKLCNPNSAVGRQCVAGFVCGSNYDSEGNPRFKYMELAPWNQSSGDDALFHSNLNFGFTSFDNLGRSAIIILQTLTASGWMVLTQTTQSTGSPVVGGIFFTVLMYVGMCFLLQLNMAVLFSEFEKAKEQQAKLQLKEMQRKSVLLASLPPERAKPRPVHVAAARAPSSRLSIAVQSSWRRHVSAVRTRMSTLVKSKPFINFGLVVTVLNIVILALDHHDIDIEAKTIYEMINFTFMVYFGVESMVKMIGLGFRHFWIDKFNRFDVLTFVLGVVEVIVHPPTFIDGTPGGGGIFTAFRAARAFKLARMWKSLNQLLTAILTSFGEILNFLLFLVLFLLIFSLVGMELFATKYQFDPNNFAMPYNNSNPQARLHRSNFDSIQWAFFTVFQILTYDNFPAVMYDGWIAVGTITPLYFALVIILGVLIVMNMFSAILVQSVMVDKDDDDDAIDDVVGAAIECSTGNDGTTAAANGLDTSGGHGTEHDASVPVVHKANTKPDRRGTVTPQRLRMTKRAMQQLMRMINSSAPPAESSNGGGVLADDNTGTVQVNPGKSLYIFSPSNPIRRMCTLALRRREYTWVMSTIIFVSCVGTALDSPLQDSTTGLGLVLDTSNLVFAVLFSIEMALNVIARGLLFGPDAFVKDSWRLLDGFIVFVSVLPFCLGNAKGGALSGLRSLRAFRALRPLRVINKLPSLKIVVNTLFRCIPDMGRALLFAFFMLFLFGLMSLALFKGALNTCSVSPYNYGLGTGVPVNPPWFPTDYTGDFNIGNMTLLEELDVMTFPRPWAAMTDSQRDALRPVWNTSRTCGPFADDYPPTSRDMCLCFAEQNGTSWDPLAPQRFDNILRAVGGLYELTTMEGWTAVAIACIDAVDENMQPIANHNPAMMLYWWLYIIICAFFITNLFIGVLCDSFQRESYGSMVTDEQVRWIKLQKKVLAMSPLRSFPRPTNAVRAICHRIATLAYFEHFITLVILTNTGCMAVQGFGQSKATELTFNLLNLVFSVVFTLEAAVKLTCYATVYFEDGWNRFDFVIVVFTLLSMMLQAVNINVGSAATVIRVFRVGRALRLIKKAKIMKNLFDTLIVSLPAVGNVVSLLMLLYYIFAAVAVQLFAKTAFDGDMINEDQNFQSFWTAFQTLIGFSTGENWDNFTWEVYNQVPATNPSCEDRSYDPTMCGFNDVPGCVPLDGCGSMLILPFMYFFFLIMGYVGINLFSGIVVDAIGDSSSNCPVNVNTLAEFSDRWAQFDPSGTGLITAEELTDFLYTVYPPFGFKGVPGFTRRRVVIAIGELDIAIYDKKFVHFKDVPRALVQRVLAEGDKAKYAEITEVMEKLGINRQFDEMWFRNHGKRHQNTLTKRHKAHVKEYSASVVIQRFLQRVRLERARREGGSARNLLKRSSDSRASNDGAHTDQPLPHPHDKAIDEMNVTSFGSQAYVGDPSSTAYVTTFMTATALIDDLQHAVDGFA